ncbi:hypothetical protein BDQ12DRAFT_418503 [Crucibulum laeve]|uniref:Uncharacterized protein n=1 Tax=Crucibulum laeve TaxID=68775 RepID=A0A5C3M6C8_9AGAR|nr:hypothetical protein BDQ12DRAFT_418503 [Crucibulum laeve]
MVEHDRSTGEPIPPPIYSRQNPDDTTSLDIPVDSTEPQLLIVPAVDAVNFQKGYLGAQGETAAIEGELQVKGIDLESWDRVTISLRTLERAYEHEIELSFSEVELFSKITNANAASFPSSFPFAIPLMPDTPQTIRTAHSALSHTLTATLHPTNRLITPIQKHLSVHTRRYTSHTCTNMVSPETHSIDEPTRVDVQVPRTVFTLGEIIPVYITIPPPRRELIVDENLRLRNVQMELVREVKVKKCNREGAESESNIALEDMSVDGPSSGGVSYIVEEQVQSKESSLPLFSGLTYRSTISRSGASCRFHSSRPIQLRFMIHQPLSSSPAVSDPNLPSGGLGFVDNDPDTLLVSQVTLLHSVTFHIDVHVSFVDVLTHTERIHSLSIPIVILPPPAPLPEVSRSMDEAYQKKHDQPPAKTIRHEDTDSVAPHYPGGEAGPSMLSGAPPPFEERDAPPPFCFSAADASTSSHLPTFQESESEIILPDTNPNADLVGTTSPSISGEGVDFGFLASQQFDGHSEDMQRPSTPPPTLEMASRDRDLTGLTDIEPDDAMQALELVLEEHEDLTRRHEQPPPPPPAMDDPSDPPPSIDSDFRSPVTIRQVTSARSSPPLHSSYHPADSPRAQASSPTPAPVAEGPTSHGHAPPPYLIPASHREQEHVSRPPPYAD